MNWRISVAWLALTAAACGTAPAPRPAAGQTADLVIVNGRVFTADERGTTAQAVAMAGNKILLVGTNDAVSALRGPQTRVVDAHGGTVAPGFNDSHVHFISGGMTLGDVDLAGLTTLAQVQDKIRAFAAAHADAAWIEGRGWLYSPFPGGTPTREQLDAVVPDRPAVMTCYDGHSVWVNSKALALAGITKDTPNPTNGIVVKDPRTGEPTGHLKESATALLNKVMPKPTDADRRAALRKAVAHAHQFGVTSVQNAGTSFEDVALYQQALRAGELQVRAYLAMSTSSSTTEADLDRMEETRKALGDDPTLTTGAVKIYADGVIESRTAAMLAPYEHSKQSGAPNLSADQLDRLVAMVDKRGWQIFIHAIGDRAIRMSLDAFERAAAANPAPARGRRHRLEHIEAVAAADIPRFGKLGVIASQQPMHVPLGDMNSEHPSGPWPDNVGPERLLARLGVEEHPGRGRPAHLRQRLARGAARCRTRHLGRDHEEGSRQRGRPEAADGRGDRRLHAMAGVRVVRGTAQRHARRPACWPTSSSWPPTCSRTRRSRLATSWWTRRSSTAGSCTSGHAWDADGGLPETDGTAENASFDRLRMSAHGELVEPCGLGASAVSSYRVSAAARRGMCRTACRRPA